MRKYTSRLSFYDLWPVIAMAVALIILFILCLLIYVPRIENNLQKRSSLVLSAAGDHFTKVSVSFSGRDANLGGSVTSEDLAKLAHTLIGQVWGVRVVKSELQVSKACQIAEHHQALQAELNALADKYPKVSFDKDKTNPSKELIGYLQHVTRAIKHYKPTSIIIVGYVDDSDSTLANHNLALSEARAKIVRDLLIEKGLTAKCLSVFGEGENPLIDTQVSKGQYIKFLVEEFK